MTPLAHRIIKDMMLPVKDRAFQDRHAVLGRMQDIHCFEVSSIIEMAEALSTDVVERGIDDDLIFLPFPRTFIEFRDKPECLNGIELRNNRTGILLETTEHDEIKVTICDCGEGRAGSHGKWYKLFGSIEQFDMPTVGWKYLPAFSRRILNISHKSFPAKIFALLAMINTPRIIGRQQHMPHRGLEKALVAKKSTVGKFPLHAWTEILLKVTPPNDASYELSHEAHLTGDRAFHYVRAHLRIRMGQLELVKHHSRGNPALGIKQSRYRISA